MWIDTLISPTTTLLLPLDILDGDTIRERSAYGRACSVTKATFYPLQGRYFNGVDSRIDCGDCGTARALMMVIKPDSTTEDILEETAGFGVGVNAGVMSYARWDRCFIDDVETDYLTANWHTIALTSTTDVTLSAFRLGLTNLTYYAGLIKAVLLDRLELNPMQLQHNYLAMRGVN